MALAAVAALCGCAGGRYERTQPASVPRETVSPVAADTRSEPSAGSIESLVDAVQKSVVVVSHLDRNGEPDSLGSGVVVSSDGLVATSLHVIGEGRPIVVQFFDGSRHEVTEIRAWDRTLDLAVIQVDAKNLPALSLGDSERLKKGTPLIAIGNPLGLQYSVVQGVVSAKREIEGVEMLQVAIPVEAGNSGGPLIDMQGKVQGIMTLKSLLSQNVGFAMPVNALRQLLEKPNPVPMSRWVALGTLRPVDWTILFGGNWTRRAGRIFVEGAGRGFGGRSLCLSQKAVPDQAYEVAVDVLLDDEAGAAGLVFGADGGDRHYGFYPSAGQLRLTRFDGPNVYSWTILRQAESSHYRSGAWNALRVRIENDAIECFVNDQSVFQWREEKPITGKAGLAKFRDTKASFRNFQLGNTMRPRQSALPADLIADLERRVADLRETDIDALAADLEKQIEGTQWYLDQRARELEAQAGKYKELSEKLHQRLIQNQLLALFKQPDPQVDVLKAALLIARMDNSDVDVESYVAEVEEMSSELKQRIAGISDERKRLNTLIDYFFTESGFHGSRTDYYDSANSYLDQVIDDREGLPITLSLVFLEVAQRAGIEGLSGAALPGRFMVRHTPRSGSEQFIDVFDNGKLFTRSEARELILDISGEPPADEDFSPASKRAIIVRILRNLTTSVTKGNEPEDPAPYLDLIVSLEPDAHMDRLNRALLRIRNGNKTGAKSDLEYLLKSESAQLDQLRLSRLYEALQ